MMEEADPVGRPSPAIRKEVVMVYCVNAGQIAGGEGGRWRRFLGFWVVCGSWAAAAARTAATTAYSVVGFGGG
jgi:hypothetical protein